MPSGEAGPLWRPEGAGVLAEPGDAYVVVEDSDDGVIVLLVAAWPHLDGRGRLWFAADPVEATVAEDRLEALTRPVRIGDTFLVRGLPVSDDGALAAALAGDVEGWGEFVDVTRPARDAAKAALYAAAAPSLTDADAASLGIEAPAEPGENA